MTRAMPPARSPIHLGSVARAAFDAAVGRDGTALARLLQSRFGAEAVVLTGSGTQALQLSMEEARRRSGNERIALPAFGCYDLVSAAVGADVRITFYDLDPETLRPDLDSLRRALRQPAAGVVVYHPFGINADLAEARPLAEQAGAVLIEDAAQAHGGTHRGQPLGSGGDVSVLSFGRGKGWTGGSGGALLLRGSAGEQEVGSLPGLAGRSTGISALALLAQWLLARPRLYGIPSRLPWLGLGETLYRPPRAPSAMGAWARSLALRHDAASLVEADARRRNAAALLAGLADVAAIRTPPAGNAAGFLRLPLRLPGRAAMEVVAHGGRRLGLLPSYPRPLPDLPQARARSEDAGPFPGAAVLARELFTAPTHSQLRDRDVAAITRFLRTRAEASGP